MTKLSIRPGMQFHWCVENNLHFEDVEDRSMTVLATPTGWLVELWSANYHDFIGRKLLHSQLVPDKDHVMNPLAFWNEGLHGKVVRDPGFYDHEHEKLAVRLWDMEFPPAYFVRADKIATPAAWPKEPRCKNELDKLNKKLKGKKS